MEDFMRKKMTILLGALLAFVLIVPSTSFAAESTKTLTGGQIIEGRTLLPLRSLFESLGAEVKWNAKTSSVTAEKGNTKIELTINSKTVKVNGTKKTIDVPAKLINSSTMVPVRFISETLGAKVEWNKENSYALINYQGQQIKVLVQAASQQKQSELQTIKSHALKGTTPQSTKIKVGEMVQKVVNTYGKTSGDGMREYYTLEYKNFTAYYMGLEDGEGTYSTYDSKTTIYNLTAQLSKAYSFEQIKAVFGSNFERGYDTIPGKTFITYDLGSYKIYFEAVQEVDPDAGYSMPLSQFSFKTYSVVNF